MNEVPKEVYKHNKEEYVEYKEVRPFGFLSNIPNFFTLLNLIFGCIAIVYLLQTGETIVVMDNTNNQVVVLPERIWQGALFIFAAAVIDFLDGFVARLMKAPSEMGKQLDSLSDVVSFGVAPGMILYQFLRMSYAADKDGLNTSIMALLPAFVFTAAVAWRLAKFNLSTTQTNSFKGVPSPAAALVVASLPLIIMTEINADKIVFSKYLINEWVLYFIIILLSYLMLSSWNFLSIKMKNFSLKDNKVIYLLAILSIISVVFLKWLAVPVIFIIYLILSFFSKEPIAASGNTSFNKAL